MKICSIGKMMQMLSVTLMAGFISSGYVQAQSLLPVSSADNGKTFRTFIVGRDRPVRYNDSVCVSWLEGTPQLKASPGEIHCFQVVVCAADDIRDVKLEFTDMKNGRSRIQKSSFTCYNTDGIDIYGKSFTKTVDIDKGHLQTFWVGVDLADAMQGRYKGSVTVGASGRSERVPFTIDVEGGRVENHGFNEGWRMSRLAWLNSTIAQDNSVTKGYDPVTVDGNVLSITGRRITVGKNGLPASIDSYFTPSNQSISDDAGPILASPMEFVIETAEGRETLEPSGFSFSQEGESSVLWHLTSESGNFVLQTDARLEFDGFIRYEMSLKAKKNCKVGDIRLETRLTPEKSRYVMGLGIEGGIRSHDIDWKWDVTKNQDMLWVGSVNGGLRLKWMDENYRRPLVNVYYHYGELVEPSSWSNGGRGGIRLTSGGSGDILLNSYSGPREMASGETLHYDFEMLVTPFRTIDREVMFSDRYFHGGGGVGEKVGLAEKEGADIINIHHASDLYPFINYPYLDENLAELKKIVADAHSHGMRMKFYYTTRELTKNLPEFWAFNSLNGEVIFPGPGNNARSVVNPGGADEWLKSNLRENYIAAWHSKIRSGLFKGETDLSVITTPDSRLNNFYIGGLDFMVREMGADGVYIDDSALDRLTVRRARKVIDTYRPAGRMDFHSWNHLCEPAGYASCLNMYMDLLPYFDLCWIGEGRDYDHPADNWLIEVSGIPFGLTGQMLQDGGNRWRGMVFGITNRSGYSHIPPGPIWKFWDEYGIQDMEMTGFWDENSPVKSDNPDVCATIYRGGHRSVIAVAGWGDKDQTVHLSLNIPYKRIFQPEINDYQPSADNIDLDAGIVIPQGRGYIFVVEH